MLSSSQPVYLAWEDLLHRWAVSLVSEWLARPAVGIAASGERYWQILRDLLPASQCRGPLVSDAALAAVALEHGLVLSTNDRDFTRFPNLRTDYPLAR